MRIVAINGFRPGQVIGSAVRRRGVWLVTVRGRKLPFRCRSIKSVVQLLSVHGATMATATLLVGGGADGSTLKRPAH